MRLLLLLIAVPLVELVILLRLAERTSWLFTITMVVVTGAIGAWLARREGLRTLARIQKDLAAGTVPHEALVEGLLILVAGVVLITPGILTDAFGFALLIPPARRWIRQRLIHTFQHRVVSIHDQQPGKNADETRHEPFIDVVGTGRDVRPGDDDR